MALIARFIQGDRTAFEAVVTIHRQRIAQLTHRLLGWPDDVDDLLQEIFLTAWRKRRQCRAEHGQQSLGAWLTAIAVSRCRSHHRRAWRRARLKADRPAVELAASPAADRSIMDHETFAHVRSAVQQLPARDREAIVLHYLEQMSIHDVATLLGQSRNAVEVRLHRARKRLKAMLGPLMSPDTEPSP